MRTRDDIINSLSYHSPDAETLEVIQALRTCFSTVASVVHQHGGDPRCSAIAQTKLEEALMWAIKAQVVEAPIAS